eukprot:05611.XXX_186949_187164_1 [CDS] Oithona nana genome sequencing.
MFCFLVKWLLMTSHVFSAIFYDYTQKMLQFHVSKDVSLVVKVSKALGTLQSSVVFLLNKWTVKFTFRFVIF